MTFEFPDFKFDEQENLTLLSKIKTKYPEIKGCDNSLTESEIPSDILTTAMNCLKSSDKYLKTAEALKKSNGYYILGDYVIEAKTNDKFEPDIKVEDAVFVPCGSEKGYFISMSYLDLTAAFIPYDTSRCVFVGADNKAVLLDEISVWISLWAVSVDNNTHIVMSGGCNNGTAFVSVYSITDGKPKRELLNWNISGYDENHLNVNTQMNCYSVVWDSENNCYKYYYDDDYPKQLNDE